MSKSTAQVSVSGEPLWEFHASGKSIQVYVEGGSVSEGKYLNAGGKKKGSISTQLAEEEQQAMNAKVRNARQRVFTDLLSRRSPRDASVPLKKLRAAFQAETSKAKLRRGKYGTVVALAFVPEALGPPERAGEAALVRTATSGADVKGSTCKGSYVLKLRFGSGETVVVAS